MGSKEREVKTTKNELDPPPQYTPQGGSSYYPRPTLPAMPQDSARTLSAPYPPCSNQPTPLEQYLDGLDLPLSMFMSKNREELMMALPDIAPSFPHAKLNPTLRVRSLPTRRWQQPG